MALTSEVAIEISDDQRAALEYIDNFDYFLLAKKVREEIPSATDKYLREGIENLKRYYAVRLLDADNQHGVSVPVDVFWHTHVIFTREYMEFCDRIFGRYIHHVPVDRDDTYAFEQVREIYKHTLESHRRIFKTVDTDWWPGPNESNGPICTMYDIAPRTA